MDTRVNKNKKRRIIIIGARMDGHAGVILDALQSSRGYKVIGFIDNANSLQDSLINGIPILGRTDDLPKMKINADCVHIAIGDNAARGRLFELLKKKEVKIATIIHPSATVSRSVKIGEGSFIGANAVIGHNAVIGKANIINAGAIIEHDTRLAFSVYFGQGAKTEARVSIDDYCFVGVGAAILPDIHIGSAALIGPNAVVDKDVPSQSTVIKYGEKKHIKNIYVEASPDVSISGKIYVAQPTLPEYPLLDERFRDIAKSLILSNFAKYARELEMELRKKLSVKAALTFPNATSALMLVLKAMNLSGEVILPSFTFSATGHAVAWNGLTPVFADIDPYTFNISPEDVKRKITSKTSAILAVHIFGNPADVESLEPIAQKHNLKLIFDSAHALGSKYKGIPVGSFGDAECFSFSGTKVITSAEGGAVSSDDEKFMELLNLGRNYGSGNNYDCQFIGLNGKMSEFHAAIALEGMPLLDRFVERRNDLANLYRKRLSEIPGIRFQRISDGCVSTFKDFSIIVEPEKFGIDRDELSERLCAEGVFTKKYFYPPLHKMAAYQRIPHRAEHLVNTEFISQRILCLPIYSHMDTDTLEKICYAIYRVGSARKT